MEQRFYTIGMAGHIDHGKTELTKALTQVDTDRLKEEKERRISIELGYAPFQLNDNMQVSIIDVPGHEKFIRQMIAGVAGIDLVIIVIAADEGVMPQTEEHIEILSFLGICQAVIAVTKSDEVDEEWLELVQDDVTHAINDTPFEDADIFLVDSISKKGIPELTKTIEDKLTQIPGKKADGSFRLPIDQAFTIQGQGTVVRGTVFEGSVKESDMLKILPQEKEVRVRQLQVQHQMVKEARAGQRAALNLSGISKHDIHRGDVLVDSNDDLTTKRIDVLLRSVFRLNTPLKQRAPLKVHIGTAIVMARIIFFDRNKLESDQNVLCQLQLDELVVAKRGERFIVRRPTPAETIGGGWVIDARADKHRFGDGTVHELTRKKEGTPEDRILDVFRETPISSKRELLQQAGLGNDGLNQTLHSLLDSDKIREMPGDLFVLTEVFIKEQNRMVDELKQYHDSFSLRSGIDKADMIQSVSTPPALMEVAIEDLKENEQIKQHGPFLALFDFTPSLPDKWRESMSKAIDDLRQQGLQVTAWEDLVKKQDIPEDLRDDLKHYLLLQSLAYKLDSTRLVHKDAALEAARNLLCETEEQAFTLQDAKGVLNLSRKHLVPFLELLDELKFTVRGGNERKWVKRTVDEHLM